MDRRGAPRTSPVSRTVSEILTRLDRAPRGRHGSSEVVPTEDALGRITAGPVRAHRTVPSSDQSRMDGFAVSVTGVGSDPGTSGARFHVVGRSYPGIDPRRVPCLRAGDAVEVLTGAPLPRGAVSILRSEDVRRNGGRITALAAPFAGRDIARRGEDFRPGQELLPGEIEVRPWHIAALRACDVTRIVVRRRLRAGVLATGTELVTRGRPVTPGRVRDTTRPMLLSLLEELRVTTLDLGVVPDMDDKICRAVQRGLRECDVVITTGGSSVGSRDRVPRAIAGLPGIRWVAKRVRMRPGSPTGVATVRGTPVFVLPGPPVSALAAFISLVEPFLRTRGGLGRTTELTVPATLGRTVPHARGLHAMIRVRLAGSLPALRAVPIDSRNAGGLSSLVNTAGLAILEEGHGEYERGEAVRVFRL